jgi:hypothetical protein
MCGIRITSIVANDIFLINDECADDGCLFPSSAICYFNALGGDIHYELSVDLTSNSTIAEVHSPRGLLETVGGKEIRDYRGSDPLFFVVQNRDNNAILTKSVSIHVDSDEDFPGNEVRGRWESGGLKIFYEPHQNVRKLPSPAYFVIASILCLDLSIAAIAITVCHSCESQRVLQVVASPKLAVDPRSDQKIRPDAKAESLPDAPRFADA